MHRPLRADESLELVMTWREPRKVTKSLTVQYDRVMYMLQDTLEHRRLIERYIEIWEYPDGRIELRADGRILPCRQSGLAVPVTIAGGSPKGSHIAIGAALIAGVPQPQQASIRAVHKTSAATRPGAFMRRLGGGRQEQAQKPGAWIRDLP